MILLLILIVFLLKVIRLASVPLFGDEALYCYLGYQYISQPVSTAWNLTVNHWGDAPGLILMNALSLMSFGIFGSITACRITAVIATMLGAIAFVKLLKLLKVVSNALIAATLFLILNPFNFFFDRTSLMDPIMTALGLIFMYFSLKFFATGRVKTLLTAQTVWILTLITKTNALFLLPIMAVLSWEKKTALKKCLMYFTGTGAIAILVSLWFYRETTVWKTVFYHVGIVLKPINNLRLIISWYRQFLTPINFLALFLGTVQLIKLKRWGILSGFFILISIYVMVSGRLFPRYLLLTLPFMAMVIGFSMKTRLGKAIFLILITIFIIKDYQILFHPEKAKLAKETRFEYYEDWTSGLGSGLALEYINSHPVTTVRLLAPTDLTGLVFILQREYAKTRDLPTNYFKDSTELKKQLSQYRGQNLWVMTTTHHVWIDEVLASKPIYITNGKERNSVSLYLLTRN